MPSGDGALPHLHLVNNYYVRFFFGTAQSISTFTDMSDLTVIFTQYSISERVRQFLGPRAQWVAQLHQTATNFCDYIQGYLNLLERPYHQAVQEEAIRERQTLQWLSHLEPHEETMHFGPLDSEDAMSMSSDSRWSSGS